MKTYLTVLLFLGMAAPVIAQDGFPYDLETGREAAILGTTVGLFGAGWFADRDYTPLTPEEIAALDPASLPAIDRAATRRWSPKADHASDIMVYTLMAAPLSLALTDRGSKEPGTLGMIYLETMLLESGTVYLLKNLFERTRPFVYNDDPDIPLDLKMSRTARRSFPSGHAANAFSSMVFTATVYSELYPDSDGRGWVWGGCMAAATTTAYLRYAAGRHFLTDLLAGAAIGSLAGWLVPQWHAVEPADQLRDPGAKSDPGMTLSLRFGF
jgi:membrane-associated phospholipid phosphatase